MEVLLLKGVEKLGREGDVVRVSDGYARNFLFPKNLARPATDDIVNEHKQRKISEGKLVEEKMKAIKKVTAQLKKEKLSFPVKTGDGGVLFAALHGDVIADKVFSIIEQKEIKEINRDDIVVEASLKELGDHEVGVKLGRGEYAQTVTVSVTLSPEQ